MQSLEAPDFTLPDLEGRPHALRDYRGKKVFLVSWASW
jgi:peroxiredoxin